MKEEESNMPGYDEQAWEGRMDMSRMELSGRESGRDKFNNVLLD